MFSPITLSSCAFLLMLTSFVNSQKKIENSIADPVTVYKQRDEQVTQRCKISGPPLDLMFVIDSSGSLRDQFDNQLQVVRNTLNNLAIAEDSVRVSIIQYASIPKNRFSFNTYFNRNDMLKRVNTFTTTGSTTNTGKALEYAIGQWTEDNGMRPERLNVKRILFLLSDGRSTDYPQDKLNAEILRKEKNIELYAFGLGEYIDWAVLREVVSGSRREGYLHVVNSRNVSATTEWFNPWKGVEICEEVPVCIPGSHRPLDLMFIIDSSTSVTNTFEDGINFARRAINSVNIHPDSTRVSMIVYSSTPRLVFKFDDPSTQNNSAVLDKMMKIDPVDGTTKTASALKLAYDVFGPNGGGRPGAEKLAIVVTDGFSTDSPGIFARRLIELKDVDIIAVSLTLSGVTQRNRQELLELTGHRINKIFPVDNRVFSKGHNLIDFETALLSYTDKSCPELNIADGEGVPVVQTPTDTVCNAQGMRITIRFKDPFMGMAYTIGFADKPGCHITGSGTKEVTMIIAHGGCGLKAVPTEQKNTVLQQLNFVEGDTTVQTYKVTIGLRFHEFFDTIADSVINAECEYGGDVTGVQDDRPGALTVNKPADAACKYMITPRSQGCELLDAEVGKQVTHEWTCAGLSPRQYIFVHDCVVDSDTDNSTMFNVITDKGCEVDEYLMETPLYGIEQHPHKVTVNTYIVKQPMDTIVRYRCLISVCDRDASGSCKYLFQSVGVQGQVTAVRNTPSACLDHPTTLKVLNPNNVLSYKEPLTKNGFQATFGVTARRINVFHRDALNPASEASNARKYCKGF
jgi:uncharacterized protein YegL